MITQPQNHTIDEMLADFGIYLNTNLLKKEYQDSLDSSKVTKENLEKYCYK